MSFFKRLLNRSDNKFDKTVGEGSEGKVKTFEEIKGSIFPYFKQFLPATEETQKLPDDLSEVKKDVTYEVPDLRLVITHVCADLNCLYAIDTELGYEIIQESKLLEWNIDKESLHEIALRNFRDLVAANLKGHGDTNGIMLTVNGNLEAGLVLMDEIWDQFESQVGEPIVVAIPSRDVLVATGKSNRAMIDNFTEKAKDILLNGDHPLSKNWIIRDGKTWKLFEPILPD